MDKDKPDILSLTYLVAKELDKQKLCRIYLSDPEYLTFNAALASLDSWRGFISLSDPILRSGYTPDSTMPNSEPYYDVSPMDHAPTASHTQATAPESQSKSNGAATNGNGSTTALSAAFRARSMIFEQFLPQLFPSTKSCCKPHVDVEVLAARLATGMDLDPSPQPVVVAMASSSLSVLTNGIRQRIGEDDDYDNGKDPLDRGNEASPASASAVIMVNGIAHVNGDASSAQLVSAVESDKAIPLRDLYYTLEFDLAAMIEQQKLEESEAQEEMNDKNIFSSDKTLTTLNAGNLSLKYLLSAIEANRSVTSLTDRELRNLLSDVKPHRSKWANEEKVGQEELYEACEKVLLDLKNYTEHSTPFLNKVNKREAPDYFDVITKPMDLGTVTKKLRSFQYKSKKEFEADLYLIYENCLTYNTNPLSEYRKHAYAMKRKTAALLLQVPEIVIRDRAELEAEEEAEAESDEGEAAEDQQVSKKAPGSNKHLSAATAAAQSDGQDGRARESSAAPSVDGISNGTAAVEPAAAANGVSVAPGTPMQTSPHNGAAVGEPMDGVVMTESSGIDLEQEEKDVSAEIDADTGDVQFEAWKEMTKRARAKICAEREKQFRLPFSDREAIQRTPSDMRRFALLETAHDSPTLWRDPVSRAGGREGVTSPGGGDRDRQAAALYDDEDDDDDDRRRKDEGMFLPEYVVTSGMSELWDAFLEREEEARGKAGSEGVEGAGVFSEARKRLFEVGEGEEGEEGGETGFWASRIDMAAYPEAVFPNHGVAEKVERNIEELKAIREVYNKCQMQRGVMETRSALPALTLDRTRSLPPPAPRLAPGPPPDELPPLVMNEDAGLDLLGRVVARMLAHAGFEGAHATAANVVTEVAVDYMLNLGRSLRIYMDNYNKGMTPEEIILHTLYENGVNNISELESYVRDEIERYGTKLGDIHRRLDATYNEIINGPAEGHVIDDDALFAEEDVFASGSFGEDLGEDFFGFKELGLDKEFGLESLAIPSKLWFGGAKAKSKLPGMVPKEKPLQYPPPPQFTPITDADSQIGLLRPFFAKKLEETSGNLVEDEFMVNKFRSRPRLPPSGKLNPTGRKRPIKEDLNELKKKKRKKAMEQLQAERAEKKKQKAEAKAAKVAEKEQKKRQKEEIKEKERLMKLEARKEKAAANKKDKASSSAATEAPTTEGSSPAGNESEEPVPSPSSSRIMENEPSPAPDEVEVVPKKKKKKGKDKEE